MATRKKTKAQAKAKRKKTFATSKTRRTVRKKARTTRKKVARKALIRSASPKKARPTAKVVVKPKPVSQRAGPEAVKPSQSGPTQPTAAEQPIGAVTHYFSHLSVAAMQLEPGTTLRVGDLIHILGHTTDFTQKVESLEINRAQVSEVGPNDDFGLKVIEHAREHDAVFKVTS
jgi:hypothetical protein